MPYQRYTRAQLRTQLQDRYEASPFWTADDANQALNDALLYWNALTGYWRQRITVPVPAGDPYVSLPSTLVQGTAVSIADRPLTPSSLAGLSLTRSNWRRETVASGGAVPTEPTIWAPVSLTLLVIWPAGTANLTATVDGVRSTPRLTADGDFLDADDSVISALLGYAAHLALLKAPGTTLLERSQGLLEQFLLAAADRNAALRGTDWYRRLQRTRWQDKQQPIKRTVPDDTGGPGRR